MDDYAVNVLLMNISVDESYNEEVRELFKIILNILFSSESDLDRGLEILIDVCEIPEDKAKRLYINKARQYSKYDELKFDQGLILHIEYWERK